MKWNDKKGLWYLICRKARFVQEFFDCDNVHSSFPDLKKEEENQYKVIITKENQMPEEVAEAGRLTSKYTMEVINDKGVRTIEGYVVIRDQSFVDASVQLSGVLNGLMTPAQDQLA
jgi:hypothetical protein